jgi:hypothetical protein
VAETSLHCFSVSCVSVCVACQGCSEQ